jgi:RNA polymerase sigma factor (sigma-70 family)
MAGLQQLVHHIRRLVTPADPVLDAVLLHRFAHGHEEDAFAAIVARHGPMVLRVCQRVLADSAAAEDCFQATFLVLARKAGSLRRPEALAGWLHGVALHIAAKARKTGYRQPAQLPANASELPDPRPDPLAQLTARELLIAVDEEVQRLPEVYRLPVILCCLENLGKEETARRLGWTVGSVKARLERGRKRLEARLTKRGLTLSAALVVVGLSRSAASAAIGPGLRATTTKAALNFAAGMAAEIPGTVIILAKAALQSMAIGKLKLLTFVAVALAITIAGAGGMALQGLGGGTSIVRPQIQPKSAPSPEVVQIKSAPDPGPRIDASGDPLPLGALARLGSLRFRLGNKLIGLALSPDGKTAITVGGNNQTQFWDMPTGKLIRSIDFKQGGGGQAVVYSPDGQLAASIRHGGLHLWEAATGKHLAEVSLKMRNAQCLAFSPTGLILAAGGYSATYGSIEKTSSNSVVSLWQWNGTDFKPLWEAKPDHEAPSRGPRPQSIMSLAFSADGKQLATGGYANNIIRIWDVEQGKEVRRFKAAGAQVSALAFAPSENALASGSDNGELILWEAAAEIKTWQSKLPGDVRTLAFAPNGKTLAAGGGTEYGRRQGKQNEPFLVLVDSSTGREVRRVSVARDSVASVAFSNDSKIMAAGLGGTIRVWDAITGKERSISNGHENWISSVAVAEDGKEAVTAGGDGALILWDLASGTEKRRLKGHQGEVRAAQFVPGGKFLASASSDQTVRLWDLATSKEVQRLEGSPAGLIYSIAVSPDGKTLASGDYSDGSIRVWDLTTGQLLHDLNIGGEQGRGVMCLAFSHDGAILGAGEIKMYSMTAAKSRVLLWETKTGKKLREFPAHEESVTCLAFSPDDKTLVSTGYKLSKGWKDQMVGFWDVDTGKRLIELPCDSVGGAVAFSPDGKTMAWGASPDIWLWETASKKLRGKFTGHSAAIHSLAFTPDGKSLVSGSMDTTALVWDITGLKTDPTPPPPLSQEKLRSLWTILATPDAEEAGRAIWTLTADPKRAVPFVVERLRALPRADPQRIPKLIADLDSPIFKVRDSAENNLVALGKLAVSNLREALARQPALEVKLRIEKIIEKREAPVQSPEILRTLRALEVLEHVGTVEARQALETFARQGPEVYLEQEARAAAERLRKR